MFEIYISDRAQKQLNELPKTIQNRIGYVIERLKIRPYDIVEKIIGSPFYRAKAGSYRIILDIKNDKMIIIVIEVGHRKKIYKKF